MVRRRSPAVLACGRRHSLRVLADGTVTAAGRGAAGECAVQGWRDIVAVASGNVHPARNTGVAVAAGDWHTVGVRADGTALATGIGRSGQCAVQDWRDLVDVAAGHLHTVGLREDGTVVSAGRSGTGACEVGGWREVVAVAAGSHHTVGLAADGTVHATGANGHGQCDVTGWRDVAHVAAGALHTLGLRADGTVLAAGDDSAGQCTGTEPTRGADRSRQRRRAAGCAGRIELRDDLGRLA